MDRKADDQYDNDKPPEVRVTPEDSRHCAKDDPFYDAEPNWLSASGKRNAKLTSDLFVHHCQKCGKSAPKSKDGQTKQKHLKEYERDGRP